jgi:hypothetical protein
MQPGEGPAPLNGFRLNGIVAILNTGTKKSEFEHPPHWLIYWSSDEN